MIEAAMFLLLTAQTAGLFDFDANNILIFPDGNIDRMVDAFFHETGHFYFATKLDVFERTEYMLKFRDKNQFVSEYAKTDAEEDFAEEYRVSWKCERIIK